MVAAPELSSASQPKEVAMSFTGLFTSFIAIESLTPTIVSCARVMDPDRIKIATSNNFAVVCILVKIIARYNSEVSVGKNFIYSLSRSFFRKPESSAAPLDFIGSAF